MQNKLDLHISCQNRHSYTFFLPFCLHYFSCARLCLKALNDNIYTQQRVDSVMLRCPSNRNHMHHRSSCDCHGSVWSIYFFTNGEMTNSLHQHFCRPVTSNKMTDFLIFTYGMAHKYSTCIIHDILDLSTFVNFTTSIEWYIVWVILKFYKICAIIPLKWILSYNFVELNCHYCRPCNTQRTRYHDVHLLFILLMVLITRRSTLMYTMDDVTLIAMLFIYRIYFQLMLLLVLTIQPFHY